MKMKIFSMVLVLALLASQSVLAESLFDLSLMQSAEKAISYGVSMGKEPISQQTLSDGSKQEMYVGVTDEDFLAFGTALAERGYSSATQDVANNLYTTVVAKGEIQITIQYDRSAGALTVIYPAAVEVEVAEVKDPFEGYIVIEPNIEVKMFDTLRITVDNKISDTKPWKNTGNTAIWSSVINLLSGTTIRNYANQEKLPDIKFCYRNADGSYQYEGIFTGYSRALGWDDAYLELVPLEPVTSYIAFDLPSALLNDSDPNSIWALTFEREDSDEKYVLYLDKTLPKEE